MVSFALLAIYWIESAMEIPVNITNPPMSNAQETICVPSISNNSTNKQEKIETN